MRVGSARSPGKSEEHGELAHGELAHGELADGELADGELADAELADAELAAAQDLGRISAGPGAGCDKSSTRVVTELNYHLR